jgi:sulfur carrier protein
MVTIRINGEEETLTAGTVAELVAAKSDIEGGRGLAVAVNGTLVRRTEWASRRLSPGDAVEIVRAMQGG